MAISQVVILMPPMQLKEDRAVRVNHMLLLLRRWGLTKVYVLVHVPLSDIIFTYPKLTSMTVVVSCTVCGIIAYLSPDS